MARMFVAVTPSIAAVEDFEDFLAVRREAAAFRWTMPEQWHVTLAFCADVPERALDDLGDRLGRAAGKRRRMTAAISGGGAFPHVGSARVLWAGLDLDARDAEELRRLATGVRAAAARAGLSVDGARFRPHLTAARMGRPIEATNWVRLLDAYRGPAWPIEEVSLVASYLGEGPRGRPRYEVLGRWPLAKTTPG